MAGHFWQSQHPASDAWASLRVAARSINTRFVTLSRFAESDNVPALQSPTNLSNGSKRLAVSYLTAISSDSN